MYTQRVLQYLREQCVKIEEFCPSKPTRSLLSFLGSNFYFVRKLLAPASPPRLLLQDFYLHPWFFIFALLNRCFHRHKLVVFVQLFYHRTQGNMLLNWLDKLVAGFNLRSADLIIANSRTTAEECRRLAGGKVPIEVVYPGCDFPDDVRIRKEASERHPGPVRLLCVANYVPRKGIQLLIEMMRYLHQQQVAGLPDITLTVAGNPYDDPEHTRQLEEQIARSGLEAVVRLVGRKTREEIFQLYRESDVFVFASVDEGFGMVVAEAIKCGLPVVAIDIPVLHEFVENAVNGYLIPERDPKSMAQAVAELASNPVLREGMAEASSLRASQVVFSWHDTCERFYRVLSKAASR